MMPVEIDWRAALRALARWHTFAERGPAVAPGHEPRILAMVANASARLALQTAAKDSGCALVIADGGSAVVWPNRDDAPPIVVLDRELSTSHWREIVQSFAMKAPRPYIILLASNTDANLWDELERAGGSDLLRTPLDPDRLAAALAQARQLWFAGRRLRPPAAALTK